jgi:cytochrome c553
MKAFASGERRNDSYGQMRNMVRLLTPQELESVAEFYARREPAIASR